MAMNTKTAFFSVLLFYFCLVLSVQVHAQFIAPDTAKTGKRYSKAFGLDAAYEYQKTNGFYLGLNYLSAVENRDSAESNAVYAHIIGPNLGFSVNYETEILWGQRFGANYYCIFQSLFGLNAGVFAENYATQKFTQNDFRLGAMAGISASGVLSLNYSYSQPLNKETLTGQHKISLVLNLNFVTLGTGLSKVVRY